MSLPHIQNLEYSLAGRRDGQQWGMSSLADNICLSKPDRSHELPIAGVLPKNQGNCVHKFGEADDMPTFTKVERKIDDYNCGDVWERAIKNEKYM